MAIHEGWTEHNPEFGYQEITHHNEDAETDPTHFMEFDFDDIGHTIKLRGKSQISHSTGLTLWTCSQILCGYLIDNPHHVKDELVLELGAGLGLCGIVAHHLGAKKLLATDGDVKVLENLKFNMKLNGLPVELNQTEHSDDCSKKPTRIACPQLVWDNNLPQFEEVHGKHSVIMGTDVFYAPASIEPLWQTVDTLLKPDGSFLLAFCPHKVTIEEVLDKAAQYNFTWKKPNISGASDESDEDEGYLTNCSFGYHIFVFQRK